MQQSNPISISGRSRTVRALMHLTAACTILSSAACKGEPEWRGTPVTPERKIQPVAFVDSAGAQVQLLPSQGQASLVFFGYTNCPDVCPTTLSDWVRVKQSMGSDASRVRFTFVTIDPERDTPAVAQRYAAKFDSSFIGLSASPTETAAVQNAFGSTASKVETHGANHEIGHSSQTYLVDERGTVRVEYRYGAGWDVMSADLKTLLRK